MDRFPGSGFAGYLAKLSWRFSPNWRQTTGGVLRSAGGGVLPARVEEAGPRPHERRLFGHGRRHGGALLRGPLPHLPRDPLPGGGIPLAPGSLEGTRVRGWGRVGVSARLVRLVPRRVRRARDPCGRG